MKKLLALLIIGAACAHTPPAPVIDTSTPIVLPEMAGGKVEEVLLEISNVDVGAVTLPGLPPIFLKRASANNPCLVEHEEAHVQQQKTDGGARWSARYMRDLLGCLHKVPMAQRRAEYYRCYTSVGYEVKAFKAQEACTLRATAVAAP